MEQNENDDFVLLQSDLHLQTRELPKEATARSIAERLLRTFQQSLLLILTAGFGLILIEFVMSSPPKPAASIIKESFVRLITGVATFGSTLFGPLLGFVLGYYFGEKKNQ